MLEIAAAVKRASIPGTPFRCFDCPDPPHGANLNNPKI
jgi:hypothetical protein